MAMENIYFTDDIYRPVDSSGNIINPSPPALSIRCKSYYTDSETMLRPIYGFVSLICRYNPGSSTTLDVYTQYVTDEDYGGSFYAYLRTKVEISTDNFSHIIRTSYSTPNSANYNMAYMQTGGSVWCYERDNLANSKSVFTVSEGAYIAVYDIPLTISDTVYQVRVTAQTSTNGSTWTDTRSRVFSSYAPFDVALTPTKQVVMNGVNIFNATIDGKFQSQIIAQIHQSASSTEGNDVGWHDDAVRNEYYPYIDTGETTNYIYWNCFAWNGTWSSSPQLYYYLRVALTIQDPGDSRYRILVSDTVAKGAMIWGEQDDKSAYSGTVSILDLSGNYDAYGYLLRNTGSVIRSTASVSLKYGATGVIYAEKFGKTTKTILYDGREDKTVTLDQYVPTSGTTATTKIYVDATTATETFTAQVLDYFVPSFPNLAIHRCDADGTLNDNGDHCRIEWSVNIMPIDNQNSKKLAISHSEGTTTYNPLDSYTQSGVLIVAASTESSYNIVFTATDDLNSEKRTLVLSTAGVIMDWLYGGKGVTFGKVASKQMSVEISEMWKLICYNLIFSGTDMSVWMKEVIARLKGIEQFASNLGSTSQYQVTFYNDSTMLDRQWVRSGEDADDPGLTPEKEATETTTYSFAGWALTNGATTANPNALKNITSYRSIYAAFASATRYYAVFFYNGGTLLNTVTDLRYHGNASYSGNTPTSDTGIFVGWRKSGRYITENTSAYAQFYDDSEITDSWDQIISACDDGTYREKYKQGNWKMLDLGTEGNIKMRIKGFNIHYGPGMKKLPISWEADTKLATNKRMNPNAVPTYEYVDEPQWGDYSGYWAYFNGWYECRYRSNARTTEQTVTRATITVRALRSTTLTFGYQVSMNSANSNLKITCNGTTVYNAAPSGSSSYRYELGDYSLSMQSGDTATVTVEYYDTTYRTQRLAVSCCGTFGDDRENPPISTTIVTDDITIQYQTGYENGTGNMGGFANSELYNYLHSTVKQLLPDALRTGIKKARLNHSTVKSKPRVSPYYEFVENDKQEAEIFIPSSDEILGSTQGNTNGVDFDVQKYQYRKKGNTSSSGNDSYWCRDASPASSISFSVVNGYSSTDGAANRLNYYSYYTRPVYICFCT